MTVGKNGTGPLMVNVGTSEKPMWVDADAFDTGDAGNDYWAGVCDGGQILTFAEIDAINKFSGPVVSVEIPR
jgi:hypothetical protein